MTRGTFLKTLLGITLLPKLFAKASTEAKESFLLPFKRHTYMGPGYVYAPYIPIVYTPYIPLYNKTPSLKDNSLIRTTPQDEYYKKHRCCPECGGQKNSQTYMGYVWHYDQKNHPYKDENIVECDCGWTGIVHDMKPRT